MLNIGESNATIPLLENNLLLFENSLHDEEIPLTERIQAWLEDSLSCGSRKHDRKIPNPFSCLSFIFRHTRNISLSDTADTREIQFRYGLWDSESCCESGFSDFL